MRRLTLTDTEIMAGYRRPQDIPRLKYLVRAMDGRGEGTRGWVTAAVIKRALEMAQADGATLDPMTGYLVKEAPPKPARRTTKPSPNAPSAPGSNGAAATTFQSPASPPVQAG